jgi:hypothetical protein
MKLSPALKGQLTKAAKVTGSHQDRVRNIRAIFLKAGLPDEQAKHATKKYIRGLNLNEHGH